jgi:steroid 5-alpha reductase family enzyme
MYLALIGPLVITLLILFVSGIPPAEARMSKKAGWKEYAKKTNALLPWPPDER